MMTNLFSIFDPTSSLMVSNWSSMMLWLFILPVTFPLFKSKFSTLFNKLSYLLSYEIEAILNKSNKHISVILTALFLFIMFNNTLGLFSYNFTSSSHLSFSLSLALPLWLSYISFGIVNKTQHMLAHLVPNGTPMVLIPFMVIIETISNFIRPLTLSIRLAANMIAGHMLIALLNSYASTVNLTVSMLVVSSGVILLILESAVAVIQAYVFMVLTMLYISEI